MDCLFKNKYFEITNWKIIKFEIHLLSADKINIWFAPYFICVLIMLPYPKWLTKKKYENLYKIYKFGFNIHSDGSWLQQFSISLSFIKEKIFYIYLLRIKENFQLLKLTDDYVCYDYKNLCNINCNITIKETTSCFKYLYFINIKKYSYWIDYLDKKQLNKNNGFGGNLKSYWFMHDKYYRQSRWMEDIRKEIYKEIGKYYYQHNVNNKALTVFKLDQLINEK